MRKLSEINLSGLLRTRRPSCSFWILSTIATLAAIKLTIA